MTTHKFLNYFFATVWMANGLFCKMLNLVPRHEKIVGAILGDQLSRPLTVSIGFSEIGMAIWILTGMYGRLNAIAQIIIITAMNVLEFAFVPHLLLWGKLNLIFALIFVLLIYFNEFHLHKTP